ncbi:uncharacterized protein BJX67DRAFT_286722 [Aspergillus lucknowensis]|uniref:Uncharacterized protein n=1 Tax=Aspergillus lucknowensis TaxID=176173 RepID=A0ABR4M132_9EURO
MVIIPFLWARLAAESEGVGLCDKSNPRRGLLKKMKGSPRQGLIVVSMRGPSRNQRGTPRKQGYLESISQCTNQIIETPFLTCIRARPRPVFQDEFSSSCGGQLREPAIRAGARNRRDGTVGLREKQKAKQATPDTNRKKNRSIVRKGPKPTHRLAPAVRQDTKYRLWRPRKRKSDQY